MDQYDAALWDDDDVPEDDGPWSKMRLLQEFESWVDQYVLEVNVGPGLKIVDKRVKSQVKSRLSNNGAISVRNTKRKRQNRSRESNLRAFARSSF